jgi:hypothetical protein
MWALGEVGLPLPRKWAAAERRNEHIDFARKIRSDGGRCRPFCDAQQGGIGCVFFTQHLAEIGQTGL